MVGRIAQLLVVAVTAAACAGDATGGQASSPDPSGPEGAIATATVEADDTDDEEEEEEEPPERARPPSEYVSELYSDPDHWLCLPWRSDDACDVDLTVTRVEADGTRRVEHVAPDPAAPIDCFYVYPTVSEEEAPNSGLVPTDAERRAVRAQAAHLQVSCRLYAPMYRQITRAALFGQAGGIPDRGLAFADVVDAWRHYLHQHNEDRGVVLVGHSQGAGHLRELLARHVDPDPRVRELLVSAVLMGTTVRTPRTASTGAHFRHLEPCSTSRRVGCILSWSTYAADEPPGDVGLFGAVRDDPDERAVCTHPAALGGGAAPLDSILPANPARDGDVSTPWVRYVGLAEAECVEAGQHHYLEVRYPRDPPPGVPDDLGGRLGSSWGLHLIDGQVALGDLAALIAEQGRVHADTR
jgi:hypothetical protein